MKVISLYTPSAMDCLSGVVPMDRLGTTDVTIEKADGTWVVVHMSTESVQDAHNMGISIEDMAVHALELGGAK